LWWFAFLPGQLITTTVGPDWTEDLGCIPPQCIHPSIALDIVHLLQMPLSQKFMCLTLAVLSLLALVGAREPMPSGWTCNVAVRVCAATLPLA